MEQSGRCAQISAAALQEPNAAGDLRSHDWHDHDARAALLRQRQQREHGCGKASLDQTNRRRDMVYLVEPADVDLVVSECILQHNAVAALATDADEAVALELTPLHRTSPGQLVVI